MPQANQLLPISTQTTAPAGSVVSQPIENNMDSGKGSHFSSLLKSEIAHKNTTKSPPDQNPQSGNTVAVEDQKLPQDGKLQPISAGFYILNKGGLVAGLDLKINQAGADNSAIPEIAPEAGTETVIQNPFGNASGNTADTKATGQNTVIGKGADEAEVPAELGLAQTVTVTNTNTQASIESADDISSRSVLPEASVVGQQKAVENVLKQPTTIDDEDTGVQPLRDDARRLVALMQKQDNTASGNQQIAKDAAQENLDIDRLMQEMNDGKKLLDPDQSKINTIRPVVNALGTHVSNESAQNLNNLSGLQTVSAQPAVQLNSASNVTQTPVIDMPLKQQGWDEAMSQRVMWQINQKIQRADIRLNPPQLGPLEVRINMTEEGANVTFSSQHGVVRETVEAALPRLREMLEEQGINLANADVSEQSVAQQNHQDKTDEDGDPSTLTGRQLADDEMGAQSRASIVSVSDGVLDLFA